MEFSPQKVLALSEPTYAARPDYIEAVQKHGMVVDWRLKIVAWFDQLGDAFDMKPETIAMATNYLDRYLSRRSCGGVNLQLAATASIFLASKVEEQRPFGQDLEENHAPSPTDVMDTGRIADFRSPSPLKRHKSDTWG
ncbi:N-acetylgalactosaminyltransferase 7 [Aureococcus anophagefferens]|nr:N-acetylgalactosaminyltransferase 7 [Aureococcus anophagefferens]